MRTTTPQKVKRVFITYAWCAMVIGYSQARADVTAEEAKRKAQTFLQDSAIPLEQNGFQKGYGDLNGNCYLFMGPPKEGLSIAVEIATGKILDYSWIRRATESQKVVLTIAQAEERAKDFLQNRAQIPLDEEMQKVKGEFIDQGGGGKAYYFIWAPVLNKVRYPSSFWVTVSSSDGTILKYDSFRRAMTLKSLTPKLTVQQAMDKAKSRIGLQPGWKLLKSDLIIAPPKGKGFPEQTLIWLVRLRGVMTDAYTPAYGQTGYEVDWEMSLDAATGEVTASYGQRTQPERRIQLRPPIAQPSKYLAFDFWPVWSRDSTTPILFKTNRAVTGKSNASNSLSDQSLAWADKGKLVSIFAPPRDIFTFSSTPDRRRIAFWMMNEIYVLDLKQGAIGRINNGQRTERDFPIWDAKGEWLAMSGAHSPSDLETTGPNIFIAKVADQLSLVSMQNQWCVALLPGVDFFPAFSPDGQWLAFIHDDSTSPNGAKVREDRRWSLYIARAVKPESGERSTPIKIVSGLPLTERLSWFADGKRILLSYQADDERYGPTAGLKHLPDIIDIEAKTRKPFKMPVLHDPDLPKGKPLIVREPAVSPDGKKIAFRALRWSGNPKDSGAICIYTCNLNGTALKRITPPTNVPLTPYKYPQPGITALNAWEKLQPKPNTGVPTDFAEEQHQWLKQNAPHKLPPDDPDYRPATATSRSSTPLNPTTQTPGGAPALPQPQSAP